MVGCTIFWVAHVFFLWRLIRPSQNGERAGPLAKMLPGEYQNITIIYNYYNKNSLLYIVLIRHFIISQQWPYFKILSKYKLRIISNKFRICTVEFKPLFTSKLFIIILENNLKTTLECTTYVLSFPLSYDHI